MSKSTLRLEKRYRVPGWHLAYISFQGCCKAHFRETVGKQIHRQISRRVRLLCTLRRRDFNVDPMYFLSDYS